MTVEKHQKRGGGRLSLHDSQASTEIPPLALSRAPLRPTMAASGGAAPAPAAPVLHDFLSSSSNSNNPNHNNHTLPPSSPLMDPLTLTFSTSGDLKYHLQTLLDAKEKQLQQAGSLGQRVLAQQMELEERIRQLQDLEADKGEDEGIDGEARERYAELADTIVAWDRENAVLSSAFGASAKVGLVRLPAEVLGFRESDDFLLFFTFFRLFSFS